MSNDHRWIFNEGTGTTANDLIGSIPGTLTGDMKWGSPGRNGLGGYVQSLPTPNAWVDFGVPVGQFGTGVFTVMLWFKTSSNDGMHDLCGNRNYASNGNFFGLRINAAGNVIAEIDEDQNGTNYAAAISSGHAFNDGLWHHIAAVRGGPILQLYVDGVANGVGVGKAAANVANNTSFRLGRSYPIPVAAAAQYSDLCIFRDQLAADEIAHIFHFH